MGRKRKPTETKRRSGNPGRRPLPAEPNFAAVIDFATRKVVPDASEVSTPTPRSPEYPPPPEEISDDPIAAGMWNVLLPQLDRAGVVKRPDEIELAKFCMAHSEVIQARAVLAVQGRYIKNAETGMTHNHPALNNLHRFMGVELRLAAEFGITPAARSKVPASAAPAQNRFTRNGKKPNA